MVFVAGGVPHSIGEGCFVAEIQEPTDFVLCAERITASGRELSENKIHGGLGYERMYDCYEYKGYSEEEIRKDFFIKKKIIDKNRSVLLGSDTTDKFKLEEIIVDKSYTMTIEDSYCVVVVLEGEGEVKDDNKTCLIKAGEQLFVGANAQELEFNGSLRLLVALP